jgi:hypothetical protein
VPVLGTLLTGGPRWLFVATVVFVVSGWAYHYGCKVRARRTRRLEQDADSS